MKIRDLTVGKMCEITLVVKTATARMTKTGNEYLALEFFDGTDTIPGNFWDWSTGKIPEVNAVLDVKAQVTEWQGNKQLNVKSLTTSTTRQLADFAPTSEFDIAEIYKASYAMMNDVKDDTLRNIAVAVMEELRELWITVPAAVSVHHNFIGGTLVHSYSVATKAKAMAEVTDGADVDLTVVGAMLHDLGKLFTYRLNGVTIDRTPDGKLYEHLFIGAEFIGNFADNLVDTDNPYVYGKVRLLRHIILSHHGEREYGSPVTPQCIEAYIVNLADMLDATSEQIRVASKAAGEGMWTDKIRTLHNSQHLSSAYVEKLMEVPN